MTKDPYRRTAGLFDKIFEPLNRGLRLVGLGMFRPTKDMAILDVGCGTGAHLAMYQRYQCSLAGIDTSESMLRIATKRLGETADLRLVNARTLPFDDRSFDLVISMLAIHEMDQDSRVHALGQMRRVLRQDGRMLLIDFHPGPYRFPKGWLTKLVILFAELAAGRTHFRNYRHFISIGGLNSLIQSTGLTVERERIVGGGCLAVYLLKKQGLAQQPAP